MLSGLCGADREGLGGSLTLDVVVVWVFQRRHGFGLSMRRIDNSSGE